MHKQWYVRLVWQFAPDNCWQQAFDTWHDTPCLPYRICNDMSSRLGHLRLISARGTASRYQHKLPIPGMIPLPALPQEAALAQQAAEAAGSPAALDASPGQSPGGSEDDAEASRQYDAEARGLPGLRGADGGDSGGEEGSEGYAEGYPGRYEEAAPAGEPEPFGELAPSLIGGQGRIVISLA